jgi:hyperosmotically inducible periplasmic protein
MPQKYFLALGIGILAATTGLAACNREPREPEAAPRMSNDELDRAVTAKINSDATLAAYNLDVDADADKNAVTLSGNVPTESLRMRAVDAAKTAHTNLIITDKIDVKPGDIERKDYNEDMAREARERAKQSNESVGDSLDDAWIHTKIRTKLTGEGELPGGSVNVDVNNNVVTLRGSVETQAEKAKAGQIAKDTDGVKSVRNQLVVKPKG